MCPGEAGYDLIDGQQRMTTSYVLFAALRDRLMELGAKPSTQLIAKLASESDDDQGRTSYRYRLDLQYEDAVGILKAYASDELENPTEGTTRSQANIIRAYGTIIDFLRQTFGEDEEAVRSFWGYLNQKVKVIRIETPTVETALKIFETINDRGVGLDAMDLLKNLLFMNAGANEFVELKAIWKSLTDTIYAAGEKPLRFLRYFILASYNVDSNLREDQIYGWFVRHDNQTGHRQNPLAFAKLLHEAASAYAQFSQQKNPKGLKEPGIVAARLVGGSAIKQHFIVLLAARHLSNEQFSHLADELEKTLCVWLITGQAAKEYERKIVAYVRVFRNSKAGTFDADIASTFVAERSRLAEEFQREMIALRTFSTRKYRIRYLVARMTQHFDRMAYGDGDRRDLESYVEKGNDIEHILPSTPDEAAAAEFGGRYDDKDVVQALGNLLLLERSINRSIGADAYSAKRPSYAQSKFLMTRCQASEDPSTIGAANKIVLAAKKVPTYPDWNAGAVRDRQEWMAQVSREIWIDAST